jgi:hypothetical protein
VGDGGFTLIMRGASSGSIAGTEMGEGLPITPQLYHLLCDTFEYSSVRPKVPAAMWRAIALAVA